VATIIGAATVAIWVYLLFFRGGFWRLPYRSVSVASSVPDRSVVAVIPARDEAAVIGRAVASLLAQDYRGGLHIVVVDDQSSDGTAEIARAAAAAAEASDRLTVCSGKPVPSGWTGKLWAVRQGVEAAGRWQPDYLLLTDADIVHPPDSVRRLVEHAHCKGLVLASLMVKLRCESFAERANIPAFVFFFQMLYPFAWVNRPHGPVAAAAGGCMLVRADALDEAGGIEVIRGALIDDCALARVLKRHGPIWLGLTTRVRSIRRYAALADIRRMVVRSAYAQLRYSPLLLFGTVAAMGLTYFVPPAIALAGTGVARVLGLLTWGLMALAFAPTLRLYRRSPLWGFALPAIALQYLIFTLDSAYQYVRGRGGTWKGRVQANVSEP
jgi:hopene-associated glycosyltransferase HpnB